VAPAQQRLRTHRHATRDAEFRLVKELQTVAGDRAAEALVKNASTAMFACQTGGAGDFVVYDDVMGARALERISLDAELRRAVAGDGLQLLYQPKFGVASGVPVGAEALLRWSHPRLGAISPARFIPLAEETGLILDISAWVIRSACRQVRDWRRIGLDVPVAINLSSKDFLHGDPARLVAREIAATAIDPNSIEIEVTESVLVTDFARVSAGLAALKELGCRIALDDFGTGYSSLGYLQRLPLDRLKVDRTFVADVHRKAADGAIFGAILALAKSVGLAVVAEGVEEPEQLDWLRACGCDEAQGFLLARPMPAAELELLLASLEPVPAGQHAARA
jgi:EAL domain-containing protein (putative c-di-GMP-specific phosphodiesterase class I)